MTAEVDVTVLVPLRDEEPNVDPLLDELVPALEALGRSFEILMVDDGSTDGTFARVRRRHTADGRIRAIRFRRNFGQSAAFTAGFHAATGRFVVTFDGDLQNEPADLSVLLAAAEGADVVCGWRRARRDGFLSRQVPSAIANWLIGLVGGVPLHDNGCSLKVFRASVVKPLHLRPGMHRYLPAIASQLGSRVREVVVSHRPRRFGRSKYGLSRTFRVLADLIHLRRLMRRALDPPPTPLYEVADALPGGSSTRLPSDAPDAGRLLH